MKICVIGTRGFPEIQGGVEKHCESLYPLLDDRFKVIVFRRKPYVSSSKTYPNVKFIDIPSTTIKGFEAVFHSFLATVCSIFYSPDIVHIHNIGPALFSPILKLCGIKIVLTYHSANYEHAKWGFFAKKLLKFSEKIALRTANAIIFVNKFQMEKYSVKIRKKSYYIPNGIPVVSPTTNTGYIKSLGLESRKYIISVGRITPEKGFDILIEAYNKIKTDLKLVIVGGVEAESEYYQHLKKISINKPIVYTGYIFGEKLNEIYSNAALYVLSSLNEGFPLVLLEAMRYKLDVLVSDIPATRLVKLDNQDYFEKGSIDDLSLKLQNKIYSYRIRDYQLDEFDWDKIAGQVSEIYTSLK